MPYKKNNKKGRLARVAMPFAGTLFGMSIERLVTGPGLQPNQIEVNFPLND